MISFYKEHLWSQNIDLIKIAKSAFEKLGEHQKISWNEEEQGLLAILNLAVGKNTNEKAKDSLFELSGGKGAQFLVNTAEWQNEQARFNDFSLDIKEYIKQIAFTDIREIKELLSFIKANQLSEEVLSQAFGKGIDIDIEGFYSNLLNGLVVGIEKDSKLSSSDKKAFKTSIEYLVDKVKWPVDDLFCLIKNTEQSSILKLVSVLEKLADYKVSPEMIDREGVTAFERLKNVPIEELLPSINLVINDNHFYINKDIETLLAEIKQSNPGNARLISLIDEKYFVEQLLKVQYYLEVTDSKPISYDSNTLYLYKDGDAFYLATHSVTKQLVDFTHEQLKKLNEIIENNSLSTKEIENFIFKQAAKLGIKPESRDIKPILRGVNKPLSEWDPDDYLKWKASITEVTDDNIAEVIAVLSQAAHETSLEKKWYPRAIQIISTLSLFKSPNGGLAQISTGEGKSLIVACLAIIKVLAKGSQGGQVDIVTSSTVLAKRDAEEQAPFYRQLGVSVSHNIDGSGANEAKACYTADVVYGDLLHFMEIHSETFPLT